MPTIPNTANGKISFFTTHVSRWSLDPEGIGSTPEQVAALGDKLAAARAALAAQKQAQQAARAATATLKLALAELVDDGSTIIKQVRAFASAEGNEVYGRAWIRKAKAPSRQAAFATGCARRKLASSTHMGKSPPQALAGPL